MISVQLVGALAAALQENLKMYQDSYSNVGWSKQAEACTSPHYWPCLRGALGLFGPGVASRSAGHPKEARTPASRALTAPGESQYALGTLEE